MGPCALFKTADIEAIFGALDTAPETKPNEKFGGTECTLVAEHGLINLIQVPGGKTKMTEMVNAVKKRGAPLVPITGYGDVAYIATAKAGANAPGVLGALIFLKGDTFFAITVLGDLGEAKLGEGLKTMAAIAAQGL